MKPIQIHKMRLSERAAASQLLQRAFNEVAPGSHRPDAAQAYADCLVDIAFSRVRNAFFVAARGPRVLGAVACYPSHEPERSCIYRITDLFVDPAHRGQGLGRALMLHAEDYVARFWLKGQPGAIELKDGISQQRPGSSFYNSLGYTAQPLQAARDEGLFLVKRLNPAKSEFSPSCPCGQEGGKNGTGQNHCRFFCSIG